MNSSAPFDPSLTIGAFQIGVLVSYVLFGIVTAQTYTYFAKFPDDSPRLKLLVSIVWVCEVAHALCVGHVLWVFTISDYGRPETLAGAPPKSLDLAILFAGIVSMSVQSFFTLRIYKLSGHLWISIIIGVILLLRLVGVVVLIVGGLRMTSLGNYEAQWGWLLTGVMSIGAGSDLMITAILVTILLWHRADGHRRTTTLLDKIIAWTIETTMLTSGSWIAMLACLVTMKDNFIWLAIFAVTARVFSNSLLASLNSRMTLRAMNELEISLPSVNWTAPPGALRGNGNTIRSSKQVEAESRCDDGEQP
ncbi:hypothetical protein B0H16DRAFT_1510035 [Mycena metata]|uniref:DUF6534 domain-containing protein n=1 Tax=Mycena metata TaxID=1033252 RepID=A0AAD7K1I6_9AGAR|nr:hypothetical protein B0H16DRAFT_1510035 [Mycena metata]